MIKGTDLEGEDVVTVLRKAFQDQNQGLFNNAAQSFNHEFYWNVSTVPIEPSLRSNSLRHDHHSA